MADHSKPTVTSTYANYTSELDGRLDDLALGLDPATTSPTNVPTNAIRWASASNKWQKWNGSSWGDLSGSYSININGTVGATTPAAGSFTSITNTGGIANGVTYLNGSKVLTSGSALTFDGTNFSTTGSGTLKNLLLSGGTLPSAGNPSISLRSSDNVVYHQSGSANNIVLLDSAQNTMQSIGATTQIWNISNSEQMRLTSTGLGIGTSSPPSYGATFTVVQASNSGSGVVQAHNSTNSVITEIESEGTRGAVGTRTNHNLAFKTNQTERMRLTSTGLGIGTSSPSELIHGNGTSVSAMLLTTNTYSSGTLFKVQGDGSAFIYNRENSFLRFGTNNLERLRIDSSGNVGIGTSSPSNTLEVKSPTNDNGIRLSNSAGSYYHLVRSNGDGLLFDADAGNTGGSGADIRFQIKGGEKARITSSGNLLVGTTSLSDVEKFSLRLSGDVGMLTRPSSNLTYYAHIFRNSSNATIGSIICSSTSTSFNTSSDYRLKEDWVAVADASTRVNALKPINFAWKATGERVDGFLAHELAEVVPEAVTGEKDAVDADGNPVYQGIDQSKLVPLLTAALQEALAKIESLTARVSALEGN